MDAPILDKVMVKGKVMFDSFYNEVNIDYFINEYDKINYHLCICQQNNGKYMIYVDIEGMKGFIHELQFAALDIHSYGEGNIIFNQDKKFHCSGQKLRGLIFSIIGRKYSKSPSNQSYQRVKCRRIEIYLTVKEAEQLLERVLSYYRKIIKNSNVSHLELFPGLSLEYIANW